VYLIALLQKEALLQLGFRALSFARVRALKRALIRRKIVAERIVIVVLVLVLVLIV
jgi:hypothetical protein